MSWRFRKEHSKGSKDDMKAETMPPIQPFEPVFLASGPHAQMIAAHFLNRMKITGESKLLTLPLADGDEIAVLIDAPKEPLKGGVILMHGLGGSADAKYMISASERLTAAGYLVFRMNHRGAGQGAGLVRKMYNAGLSSDVSDVITGIVARFPGLRLVVVGFSMSGNTVLKYAGERGDRPPPEIAGLIAVNPAADMEQCIHAIEQRSNRIYHQRFTRLLIAQLTANRQKCRVPENFQQIDSIREYDDTVTAPAWGFEDASAYYKNESAIPVIPSITLPTIVLSTDDDPIIPVHIFSEIRWPDGTRLHIARGGGHMGYLARRKTPLGDRRWLDYFLVYSVRSLLR
jgi:uncharacterized protein